LVILQRGATPVAGSNVLPDLTPISKDKSVAAMEPGVPALQPINRKAEAKVEAKVEEKPKAEDPEVKVVVQEKLVIKEKIMPDELFVIYGISDNEIHFRGLHTRSSLVGDSGWDVEEQCKQLLIKMWEGDQNDTQNPPAWVARHRAGHCSGRWGDKKRNPFVNVIAQLEVRDNDLGRDNATWAGEDTPEPSPFVTYRYIIFRTNMNREVRSIPLHLL
jgi:hypothetical protein